MTAVSSTPRFAVVLNARAGGGLAARHWPALEAELRRRNLSFQLVQEDSGAAALQRLMALPPDVAVMAVGGDGTVGALLPALVGTGRTLAVVPQGTGNDFAGMLGLPPGRFAEALDRLQFQPRQVDALNVQIVRGDGAGRSFVLLNGLGMGFDAQVTANMARAPEGVRGFNRYAWAAISTLRDLTLGEVQVTVDGRPVYAGPSALVAVMNGTRYGGGFQISPRSDAQDGQLNVLASGPVTRMQLSALMLRVLRGRHLGHRLVHHVAGAEATVCWSRPTFLHLDGDLHGEVQEIRIVVLPGAVHLLNG